MNFSPAKRGLHFQTSRIFRTLSIRTTRKVLLHFRTTPVSREYKLGDWVKTSRTPASSKWPKNPSKFRIWLFWCYSVCDNLELMVSQEKRRRERNMDKPIKLTSYMKVRLSVLITSHYISQHQENCARLMKFVRQPLISRPVQCHIHILKHLFLLLVGDIKQRRKV